MKSAKKLRSTRGETMVEMLVSITLLVLAMSILGAMLAAAYHSDEAARAMDDNLTDELAIAESNGKNKPDDYEGEIVVDDTKSALIKEAVIVQENGKDVYKDKDGGKSINVYIKIYGADGALKSYVKN